MGPPRSPHGRPQARRCRGAVPAQPRERPAARGSRQDAGDLCGVHRRRTGQRAGQFRAAAGTLLDLARDLAVRLPGTAAALRDGIVSRYKAQLIAQATALLDKAESRAAEAAVLDRAGRLTPGGLRAAIARAVMEVAPEKAKERREAATRGARVERWTEDSGNAALMGRELPPDEVLAADQRITAWARELRRAGLEGDMDVLRARAFLDLLLGKDSRPRQDADGGDGTGPGPGGSGPGWPGTASPSADPKS